MFAFLYEHPTVTGILGLVAGLSTNIWDHIDNIHSVVALIGSALGAVGAGLAVIILWRRVRAGTLPE